MFTLCGQIVRPLAYTCTRRLRLKGLLNFYFFLVRFRVYEGMGILLLEVYERVGKSVIFV